MGKMKEFLLLACVVIANSVTTHALEGPSTILLVLIATKQTVSSRLAKVFEEREDSDMEVTLKLNFDVSPPTTAKEDPNNVLISIPKPNLSLLQRGTSAVVKTSAKGLQAGAKGIKAGATGIANGTTGLVSKSASGIHSGAVGVARGVGNSAKVVGSNVGKVGKNVKQRSAFAFTSHHFATVAWVTALFVWLPLVIIAATNEIMGKEFIVDLLVKVLPHRFPDKWINTMIDDGIWLAMFGALFVGTAGILLVEVGIFVKDWMFPDTSVES